jgi:hypothetical protein
VLHVYLLTGMYASHFSFFFCFFNCLLESVLGTSQFIQIKDVSALNMLGSCSLLFSIFNIVSSAGYLATSLSNSGSPDRPSKNVHYKYLLMHVYNTTWYHNNQLIISSHMRHMGQERQEQSGACRSHR